MYFLSSTFKSLRVLFDSKIKAISYQIILDILIQHCGNIHSAIEILHNLYLLNFVTILDPLDNSYIALY